MKIKQIRKKLIKIVNKSDVLPKIICIVLPNEKPYGGAYLPVYGFNTQEQNISTKKDAIELIKEYSHRDFVQSNSFQFDGGWRHLSYEKAINKPTTQEE